MRSNAAEYDIIAPPSLEEALGAMAAERLTPLAGGTEVMVALGAGRLQPKKFVSLHNLSSNLRFIDESVAGMVRIGSGTTFTDIRQDSVLSKEFPLLAQTASWTGSIANQNRGTIGGNIANASPAADTPPALLAYDAELELISVRGIRTLKYRDFHMGYKRTALEHDELLLAIRLSRRFSQHVQWVRKVGTRNAQAISKVALAAVVKKSGNVIEEIALGAASLMDRPARLYATEAALTGADLTNPDTVQRAQAALRSEAAPIDDIRSTARYRVQVACNLLQEFLQSLGS